jgi:hypothetical protein
MRVLLSKSPASSAPRTLTVRADAWHLMKFDGSDCRDSPAKPVEPLAVWPLPKEYENTESHRETRRHLARHVTRQVARSWTHAQSLRR